MFDEIESVVDASLSPTPMSVSATLVLCFGNIGFVFGTICDAGLAFQQHRVRVFKAFVLLHFVNLGGKVVWGTFDLLGVSIFVVSSLMPACYLLVTF